MKRLKRALAKVVLWFLGRGFIAAARLDSKIKKELSGWEEGRTFAIRPDANTEGVGIRWCNGKLELLPQKYKGADIEICFKSIEAATLVLTGRIGIAQAFSEHRFTLKGDIFQGMSIVRCMSIIENYLFPPFITNKILKKPIKKEVGSLRVYAAIILGI